MERLSPPGKEPTGTRVREARVFIVRTIDVDFVAPGKETSVTSPRGFLPFGFSRQCDSPWVGSRRFVSKQACQHPRRSRPAAEFLGQPLGLRKSRCKRDQDHRVIRDATGHISSSHVNLGVTHERRELRHCDRLAGYVLCVQLNSMCGRFVAINACIFTAGGDFPPLSQSAARDLLLPIQKSPAGTLLRNQGVVQGCHQRPQPEGTRPAR